MAYRVILGGLMVVAANAREALELEERLSAQSGDVAVITDMDGRVVELEQLEAEAAQ